MLKYKSQNYETLPGESWHDACVRLGLKGVLAVLVGGQPEGLSRPAEGDAAALTFQDEEGRRVYERSLRLVLLLAAQRVMPGARLRIENSYGSGVLVTVRNASISDTLVKKLENEMRSICRQALPFTLHVVSKEEAISYFNSIGQSDKAELLTQWREKQSFNLYECGEVKDYFYGEMAYDTSCVSVFSLSPVGGGFVLSLPTVEKPDVPGTIASTSKLLETYTESNAWLPEQIVERNARLVLIAGPSSSGKTTFCHRLFTALRVHGAKPVKLSLDDYYLDRDKVPLDEEGNPDLECVEALDVPLINKQLKRILEGEAVEVPTFDFVTQKRAQATHTVKVDTHAPILIEGIHGLNDRLTSSVPANQKFKIYISALMNLNLDDHNRIRSTDARLIRRLVRDSRFRGTPVRETLQMWKSVRRGEDRFIFPFQENADTMINSALVYELAIMKKYIYPQLCEIPSSDPLYAQARRLVKFLNYIVSADVEDEIPLNSLLREFIGGSCFYR